MKEKPPRKSLLALYAEKAFPLSFVKYDTFHFNLQIKLFIPAYLKTGKYKNYFKEYNLF